MNIAIRFKYIHDITYKSIVLTYRVKSSVTFVYVNRVKNTLVSARRQNKMINETNQPNSERMLIC
jgi:hypothetical protein